MEGSRAGHCQLGKTSLLQCSLRDGPAGHTQPTIGCNCQLNRIDTGDHTVGLNIWDTAGQDLYYSIVPIYVRDAAAGLLVYDVSDPKSFQDLERWFGMLQEESDVIVYVVGNKIDLAGQGTVSTEQGQRYADPIHARFFEVSAMTGAKVADLFKQVAIDVADHGKRPLVSITALENAQRDGCCAI
jgi:small GTP-binding protein